VLRVDDVIVSFDGVPILSPDALTAAIHPLKPGDRISLGIYRGNRAITISLTLGARPVGG
jgi:S1-C subfamily serine protease